MDIFAEYILLNLFSAEEFGKLTESLNRWMEKFVAESTLELISQIYSLLDIVVAINYPINLKNYMAHCIQEIHKSQENAGISDNYGSSICLMISHTSLNQSKQFDEALIQSKISLDSLLNIWISKVDYATSAYSRKINIAALISLSSRLPPSINILKHLINDIAPLLALYAKLSLIHI